MLTERAAALIITTCAKKHLNRKHGRSSLLSLWPATILVDDFPQKISALDAFAIPLAAWLYYKGFRCPDGPDAGASGKGFVHDYFWGAAPRLPPCPAPRAVVTVQPPLTAGPRVLASQASSSTPSSSGST